jgi:hypothetical protein
MGLWPTQGDEKRFLFSGSASAPLVIPTGAYPDFLLRAASDDHVCGSP